jgi:hypothetical protein
LRMRLIRHMAPRNVIKLREGAHMTLTSALGSPTTHRPAEAVHAKAPFNHRYFADLAAASGGRVLDYGCGSGETVELGRARGLDIWGADTFAGCWAGSASQVAHLRDRVRNIENGRTDYPASVVCLRKQKAPASEALPHQGDDPADAFGCLGTMTGRTQKRGRRNSQHLAACPLPPLAPSGRWGAEADRRPKDVRGAVECVSTSPR